MLTIRNGNIHALTKSARMARTGLKVALAIVYVKHAMEGNI